MAVTFQSVRDQYAGAPHMLRIFNLLAATLEYDAGTDLKSAKLAEDINFVAAGTDNNALWYAWSLVIQMSRHIPPDHPFQDCLVQAVGLLRQAEGEVPGWFESAWKELPGLGMELREEFHEPDVGPPGEELVEGEFARWKNQSSFTARISTSEFFPWFNLPVWSLRSALETPLTAGPIAECYLWVATEWLTRCTGIIYKPMSENKEDDRGMQIGPLCGDPGTIPDIGIERWNFWKKRLTDIPTEADELKLGSGIIHRMSDMVKRMEAVETKQPEP
ncbi:hypothetical protein F5Y17DRAFT_461341 [Xylariaceae sp. FL0594]|nr:hypothetical protein F5Y17DRAFT_461341 [Xylariaceae sp. FL0594]